MLKTRTVVAIGTWPGPSVRPVADACKVGTVVAIGTFARTFARPYADAQNRNCNRKWHFCKAYQSGLLQMPQTGIVVAIGTGVRKFVRPFADDCT